MSNQTAVVIPAAGSATRMKNKLNKQFLLLDGMPVLARTIQVFEQMPEIDDIIVCLNPDEFELFEEKIQKPYQFHKIKPVAGGKDRQSSVREGMLALENYPEDAVLLVHDGARPMVDEEQVRALIDETRKTGAAVLAIPAQNTIKQVGTDGIIETTPDRDRLYEAQTPQGIRFGLFRKASQYSIDQDYLGTDDVSLVEAIGHPVKIVKGSKLNMKITEPADLMIAEAVLRQSAQTRHQAK